MPPVILALKAAPVGDKHSSLYTETLLIQNKQIC